MTRPAKRHRLLLYHRWLSLYRWPSGLIAVFLFALWWPAASGRYPIVAPPRDHWALAGAIVSGAVFLFILVAPRLAFVQCRPTHLRIQTPLFGLAVSYSRIKSIRPVDFAQMYSPRRLGWSRRRFLEPFFGTTAVGVDLFGFPVDERALRFFISEFVFSTDHGGFLFLVKDWMEFSRELEGHRDAWRAQKTAGPRRPPAHPPFRG